jgi:hypothetical protein
MLRLLKLTLIRFPELRRSLLFRRPLYEQLCSVSTVKYMLALVSNEYDGFEDHTRYRTYAVVSPA